MNVYWPEFCYTGSDKCFNTPAIGYNLYYSMAGLLLAEGRCEECARKPTISIEFIAYDSFQHLENLERFRTKKLNSSKIRCILDERVSHG